MPSQEEIPVIEADEPVEENKTEEEDSVNVQNIPF